MRPRKLMTWSPVVTYKEISVALPPNALQFWRLLLSASPSNQNAFVSLGNVRSTGRDPFPVISMPIRITQKPEKSPLKQVQVEHVYRASLVDLSGLQWLLHAAWWSDLVRSAQGIDFCLCLYDESADCSRKYGTARLGWAHGWWIR